jgi:hypothetical protein
MIVVMEGPSAVGKTTWCRSHCPEVFIEGAPEDIRAPSLDADPAEVAEFWVNFNIGLWHAGLEMEREKGVAVFDGDPFHLYFSWSLWKTGAIASTLFEKELSLYRRAVEQRRLGFADRVLWREASPDELRRRAKSDATRRRRKHEVYLSLIPWMKAWFGARASVLPETLSNWFAEFRLEDLAGSSALSQRYDPTVIDRMIAALNQPQSIPQTL